MIIAVRHRRALPAGAADDVHRSRSHAGAAGFQSVQGHIALGSGGLFGRGLGQSLQKNYFLPEAHTDFILAIIGEELGAVGVMGVLTLYGLLRLRRPAGRQAARSGAYAKLRRGRDHVDDHVARRCSTTFAVLGLAPLTGVPLPFISYG